MPHYLRRIVIRYDLLSSGCKQLSRVRSIGQPVKVIAVAEIQPPISLLSVTCQREVSQAVDISEYMDGEYVLV